jgi:hypothetical protein
LVAYLQPLSEPDTGNWDNALRFEYHYDVLPASVISRFIVRMHRFVSHNTYWRRGVVLEREGHRALVKADIEDRTISVGVAGRAEDRRIMLDLIRADFERIHETIPKLQVSEKVPIVGHPGVLVDYRHLITLRAVGESTFIPEGMSERISVGVLLGEIETPGHRRHRDLIESGVDLALSDPKKQRLVHPLIVFVVALVLISAVGLIASGGLIALPIAVIGAILTVVLVHTLEEHRAGRLGEKAFLTVVKDSFAQLRLIRIDSRTKAGRHD